LLVSLEDAASLLSVLSLSPSFFSPSFFSSYGASKVVALNGSRNRLAPTAQVVVLPSFTLAK
jgi:hypothetical protein